MAKFTVTLCRPIITYSTVTVEVEAPDETAAYLIVRGLDLEGVLEWEHGTDKEDGGYDDVEVWNEAGGSTSWREE